MKKLFLILFLCACTTCTIISAQNIETIYYTYDNAGNRIGRTIKVEEITNRAPRNNAPANDGDENSGEDENAPDDALADGDTPTPAAQTDYEAKIYPNPTADVLHVKVSESSSGTFTSETTLQISGYARGIYYLSIYNDAKPATERRVWKVVKQ